MKLSQIESELFNNHGVIIQNTNQQTEAIEANIDAIKRRSNALKEEIAIEQEKL